MASLGPGVGSRYGSRKGWLGGKDVVGYVGGACLDNTALLVWGNLGCLVAWILKMHNDKIRTRQIHFGKVVKAVSHLDDVLQAIAGWRSAENGGVRTFIQHPAAWLPHPAQICRPGPGYDDYLVARHVKGMIKVSQSSKDSSIQRRQEESYFDPSARLIPLSHPLYLYLI